MLSEFRKDLVSGEWVLFSTDRAKKPGKKEERFYQPKETCPFEDPQTKGNGNPLLAYYKGKKLHWSGDFHEEWTLQVIKNKYPALKPGICGPTKTYGPFQTADANGFHEVVITRDHDKSFANFTNEETEEVLKAYKERYIDISKDECGDYIQIIHNHGQLAAASVYHNHSQILSTPIVPPEAMTSIGGAMNYFKEHNKKIHNVLIDWEIEEGKRIVYENKKFIAFCPYVSKTSYEMRIFPKVSESCFQNTPDEDLIDLADALNYVLKKLAAALDDPDYNFYIHTSPVTQDVLLNYDFYRWHVEILPRMGKIGAFELGTNIYINTIDPDDAAKLLREAD